MNEILRFKKIKVYYKLSNAERDENNVKLRVLFFTFSGAKDKKGCIKKVENKCVL